MILPSNIDVATIFHAKLPKAIALRRVPCPEFVTMPAYPNSNCIEYARVFGVCKHSKEFVKTQFLNIPGLWR